MSQFELLNDCKRSDISLIRDEKAFVIHSISKECNEAIRSIFAKKVIGTRAETLISWVVPYSDLWPTNSTSRCRGYLHTANITSDGVPMVKLRCLRTLVDLNRRTSKNPLAENGKSLSLGVALYAVIGLCIVVGNFSYLTGLLTFYYAIAIPEEKGEKNEKGKSTKTKAKQKFAQNNAKLEAQ
ncbi:unnamed protein product [Thelazia callipaeda]|uniref:Reticulon-like protein n=1 Tax=Thelazia callipaeda TaxID=103827 RepID=A0A0N5CV09_THECL|nr:unnamed protein product [Thelazia callipaeda]